MGTQPIWLQNFQLRISWFCATEHLSSIHSSRSGSEGHIGLVGTIGVTALGTLTTSGSSEADVGVTDLIEHATIAVIIVARAGAGARLAERDLGLEHWSLHVVDEDGEVAGPVVLELAGVAVVRSRELGRSVSVLAITTGGDVGGVASATDLEVGAVVCAVSLLAEVDELRPVLDLHSVVLTVGQVRDGRGGGEVLVEGVVGLEASTVGGEDGHVVVVVTDELGGVDPPAGNTLLGVVELKVVPCVELDSEELADGSGARLEGTCTGATAATVLGASHSTEGTHLASIVEHTIVVVVASVQLAVGAADRATVTSPVVTPH